jgi:hypothetical protein
MDDFELVLVSSANLNAVGYDSKSKTLRIKFTAGEIYDYYNVPESVYDALMTAVSKGRYYLSNISKRYRHSQIR